MSSDVNDPLVRYARAFGYLLASTERALRYLRAANPKAAERLEADLERAEEIRNG